MVDVTEENGASTEEVTFEFTAGLTATTTGKGAIIG